LKKKRGEENIPWSLLLLFGALIYTKSVTFCEVTYFKGNNFLTFFCYHEAKAAMPFKGKTLPKVFDLHGLMNQKLYRK